MDLIKISEFKHTNKICNIYKRQFGNVLVFFITKFCSNDVIFKSFHRFLIEIEFYKCHKKLVKANHEKLDLLLDNYCDARLYSDVKEIIKNYVVQLTHSLKMRECVLQWIERPIYQRLVTLEDGVYYITYIGKATLFGMQPRIPICEFCGNFVHVHDQYQNCIMLRMPFHILCHCGIEDNEYFRYSEALERAT